MAPYEEQARKVLQEIEATIVEHLAEMNKAGGPTFAEWLACQQTLMQVQQTHLLLGIFDRMYRGVPVYPMAT